MLIPDKRCFIHPAASEGDQAACAHTTRAPAPDYHIDEYYIE